MTHKVIIVGATSGIGKSLAEVFLREGYAVGLAGRRMHLLEDIKEGQTDRVFLKPIDVSQPAQAMAALQALISEMAGVDVIVISSGVGFINEDLQWSFENETIDVNVTGFTAMTNVAMQYFLERGSGHLVGISSLAGIRGGSAAPAYNASKAFVSNYLEGMRKKAVRHGASIAVTDIQPGYVDTAMAKGEGKFWVATARKAAEQIYNAIELRKKHAYITKRWRVIAWLLKVMPDFMLNKI